jgi:transposase
MRYELTDHEWAAIKPMLPNKPHGVPRVNDRRVLNGHLLGLTVWRTVARSAARVRAVYHLLQSLRSLASG